MGLGHDAVLVCASDCSRQGGSHLRVSRVPCLQLYCADFACACSIWTKYTLLAIPGSFVFTMAFLPIYALVAPLIGFSKEYTGIVPRLWSNLIFWMTILGLPFLLLLRDFAWKS